MSKITNDGLTRSGTECLIALGCTVYPYGNSGRQRVNRTRKWWKYGQSFDSIYSVSQKIPPAVCGFLTFFDKRLRILNQFFYIPVIRSYLRYGLQILRKSLIALLIVICGKSSQISWFYNVNKHVGYDMTSTVTSFAQ